MGYKQLSVALLLPSFSYNIKSDEGIDLVCFLYGESRPTLRRKFLSQLNKKDHLLATLTLSFTNLSFWPTLIATFFNVSSIPLQFSLFLHGERVKPFRSIAKKGHVQTRYIFYSLPFRIIQIG